MLVKDKIGKAFFCPVKFGRKEHKKYRFFSTLHMTFLANQFSSILDPKRGLCI